MACLQVKLDENQSAMAEQLDKLRAETEAANQELQKSQDRASRVVEDVISHVHSPNFSHQVTAGILESLEALKQDMQDLKWKSEVSQLQEMEGVRLQKADSTADTAAKPSTPLQAAPEQASEVSLVH